jgi:hypothetical protein
MFSNDQTDQKICTPSLFVKDKRVERELKELKGITDKRMKSAQADYEKKLKKAIAESNKVLSFMYVPDLALPTLWRGNRALADGDPAGWKDVLDYCGTCEAVFDRIGFNSDYAVGVGAPALLLLLGVNGWSPELAKIRTALNDALKKLRGSEREGVRLGYFAAFCADWMATGKAEPRGPKDPLYKLAEQASGNLTDKVLKDACEFQLKNGGLADDDDTEMVNFALNPVWWFAIARARKDLGLETPRPNHALFSTPFATLPEKLKYDPRQNPFVKRVEALDK